MTWINHPITLEGEKVILLPLEETHFDDLISGSRDEIIWTYLPVDGTIPAQVRAALLESLQLRKKNEQYPFVVFDKINNIVIGSTRLLKLSVEHRNLEIGWTWYLPPYWGKGYNEECKLLLLTFCFEILKVVRVQICASDKNTRSRKAIERIGATFEGILRSIVIRYDGKRNTACYSIIEEEWPSVKENLEKLVREKRENMVIL